MKVNFKKIIIYSTIIILVLFLTPKITAWVYNSWPVHRDIPSRVFIVLTSAPRCIATGGSWVRDRAADCNFPVTKRERLNPCCTVMCQDLGNGYGCQCPEGKFWGSMEEGCIAKIVPETVSKKTEISDNCGNGKCETNTGIDSTDKIIDSAEENGLAVDELAGWEIYDRKGISFKFPFFWQVREIYYQTPALTAKGEPYKEVGLKIFPGEVPIKNDDFITIGGHQADCEISSGHSKCKFLPTIANYIYTDSKDEEIINVFDQIAATVKPGVKNKAARGNDCLVEGQSDFNFEGLECCAGLQKNILPVIENSGADCLRIFNNYVWGPGDNMTGCSRFDCTKCGNGKCEFGETAENCAQDCANIECAKNGEWLTFPPTYCCAGLAAYDQSYGIKEDGTCGIINFDPEKISFAYICTNCGDGVCGKGENKCNCPNDCK